jgi:hypothetical protein
VDPISVLSTIYLYCDVSCVLSDGSNVDPTGGDVAFAFLPSGTRPTSGTTWTAGIWAETGAGFTAQVLFDPAALSLAPGDVDAYIQMTEPPELIVLPCGPLTLY